MKWTSAPLGELAKIERESIAPAAIVSGSRYVGLEHIENGGGTLSFGSVSNGELASNKFKFGPHHILYGKLRPYLAKIVCPDFEGICSTDMLDQAFETSIRPLFDRLSQDAICAASASTTFKDRDSYKFAPKGDPRAFDSDSTS